MGSQIVTAIVLQQSIQKTNPDEVTPEVSKPIEQQALQLSKTFQPIEQLGNVRTAGTGIGGLNFSKPVQQVSVKIEDASSLPIQQANLSSPQSSTRPIEQTELNQTSDSILQQLNLKGPTNTSAPIEQVDEISNQIDLEQFDIIDQFFPPCASIRNPVTTNILVRLNDFGFTFDTSTLIFKVNGLEVQDKPTFSITVLVNGVQFDYDPAVNFEYSAEVPIYIEMFDTAPTPNRLVISCSFFTVPDTKGPRILNVEPCGQTDVSIYQQVEFDLLDFETGIDLNSVRLNIEGIGVCSNLSFDGIQTTSGTGYHVTWSHLDRPFRYGSTVSVGIEASDLAVEPNTSVAVCRFDVEGSSPPEFINFNPANCKSFVDNKTGLKFEVYGVEDGVDISTLEVFVDSKKRAVIVRPRIRRVE